MLLSRLIRFYVWDLSVEVRHPGLLGHVWLSLQSSKVILAIIAVYLVLPLVAIFGQGLSLMQANRCLIFCGCFYSVGAMALMQFRRRRELAEACTGLVRVAEEVETDADGDELREITHMGGLGFRGFLLMRFYGCSAIVVGVLHLMSTLTPPCEVWVRPVQPGEPLAVILMLPFVPLAIACSKAWPDFTSLLACVAGTSSALHRVVATRLSAAQDVQEILRAADLLQRLRIATRSVTLLVGSYLGHIMLFTFTASAQGTLSLVFGVHDSITLVLLPVLFVIYMPICCAGDLLQDTSGQLVSHSAYDGCWLELDVNSRLLVLNIMSQSDTTALNISVKGIGRLNRATSFVTVSIWFKYLQMLLNMQRL